MPRNPVKEKLQRREPAIGTFLTLNSPAAAEALAQAGMEWLAIDAEHGAIGMDGIRAVLTAIAGTGAVPLVRLPVPDPALVAPCLDAGALGIIAPMVRTADDVARIVAAAKYPPAGTRGFGPIRAARYGLDFADYLKTANDAIMVVVILETRESMENLESILAVPGLDAVLFGSFDLSMAHGLNPLEQPHDVIDQACARVMALAPQHNVAVAIGVDAKSMKDRLAQGATMIAWSADHQMLVDGARAGVRALSQGM